MLRHSLIIWMAGLFIFFVQPFPVQAAIGITEVLWMGSDLSTSDEWIELSYDGCSASGCTLAGSGSLALDGWKLSFVDSKNIEKTFFTFGSDVQIQPTACLIISHFDASRSRLEREPFGLAPSITLSNTALLVRLRDAEGLLRDEVGDGKMPFAGRNASGSSQRASMQRRRLDHAGTDRENWQTADSSFGFDQGSPMFGDPGKCEYESSNVTPPPLPSIRITELLPDAVGDDASSEWIEIGNMGDSPESLEGLTLSVLGASATFSLPNLTLEPQEHMAFRRKSTGLTLKNSGGTVVLKSSTSPLDSLVYPALPTGVSFGRVNDAVQPLCLPTEGYRNTGEDIDTQIVLQSGTQKGRGALTLNPALTINGGSSRSISCQWDFGDGNGSASCNPPSHTYRGVGSFDLSLTTKSYCGTTLTRTLRIDVEDGGSTKASSKQTTASASKVSTGDSLCRPRSFFGAHLSEILPNPVGDDASREWVEISNTTDVPISLCGWQLLIQNRVISLDAHTLSPRGILTLTSKQLKGALRNSSGATQLLAPIESLYTDFVHPEAVTERAVLSEVAYTKSFEGQSLSWHDAHRQYLWNDLATPGERNRFSPQALSLVSHEGEMLSATVKHVIDPFTFDVLLSDPVPWLGTYAQVRVRLSDVRMPISAAAETIKNESTKLERALYEGKKVELKVRSKNVSEAHILESFVYYKGSSVQEELIKNGFAIVSSTADPSLTVVQNHAIEHGRGLWSLPQFTDFARFTLERNAFLSRSLLALSDSEKLSPSPSYRGKILISELYPSPTPKTDDVEWIEFYNPDSVHHTYRSLTLRSGKRIFTFPDFSIAARGYFVYRFSRSGVLPNAGGTLQLRSGEDILDQVTYTKVHHGHSAQFNVRDLASVDSRARDPRPSSCVSPQHTAALPSFCTETKSNTIEQKKNTKKLQSPRKKQKTAFRARDPYTSRMYNSEKFNTSSGSNLNPQLYTFYTQESHQSPQIKGKFNIYQIIFFSVLLLLLLASLSMLFQRYFIGGRDNVERR